MMTTQSHFQKMALLAPVLFLAHVAEEAPAFVPWFNSVVSRGISQSLFLSVNFIGFVITVGVTAAFVTFRERTVTVGMLAWLGFVMLANAAFHITATVVYKMYCPGVVTSAVLYLPYFAWFFRAVVRHGGIPTVTAVVWTLAGSVPMLLHGYLIVFRGERLF